MSIPSGSYGMSDKVSFEKSVVVWPLALSLLFGTGCAGLSEALRPDQQNAAHALGSDARCTPEQLLSPQGTQRFIVEWNDGDREALATEMADGVALVKYTCDGIEVLRTCAVPGEYRYRPGSRKTRSVQISDAAGASANLSSPVPAAAVQAALEQGKALNLAYVMVGSMTAGVKEVARSQASRAACQEATHFVYQAQVGAFAIESGEQGQALAAADILDYANVDAGASSGRQSLSGDGHAENCENSSLQDEEPPEGCNGMMSVSILPLVDG